MRQSVGFALSLLIGAPVVLGAQGFGIYELGSCGMARAGTGVAAPCADGSAIFFNPAGLAGLKGWHISAGGTLIKAVGNFTSDATGSKTDLDNPWIPVPSVYVAYGPSPSFTRSPPSTRQCFSNSGRSFARCASCAAGDSAHTLRGSTCPRPCHPVRSLPLKIAVNPGGTADARPGSRGRARRRVRSARNGMRLRIRRF